MPREKSSRNGGKISSIESEINVIFRFKLRRDIAKISCPLLKVEESVSVGRGSCCLCERVPGSSKHKRPGSIELPGRALIMERKGGEPYAAIRLRSGPIISDQARREGHVPKELKPHAGADGSTRLLQP